MIEVETLRLVTNYSSAAEFTEDCARTIAGSVKSIHNTTWAILILLAATICGCANSQINAARRDMTIGNYAAAHDKFVAASHSSKLNAREWRDLADGLCLTETKLGAPQYPLTEQRRICANATVRSGSSSGPILAHIDSSERAATNAEVATTLKSDDIAGAEAAVVRYQSFPGTDRHAVAGWSKQIWSTLEQQEARPKHRDGHLVPAIAALSQKYPSMRAMNDTQFKHWVMTNATVSHTPLVEGIRLRRGAIDLRVASGNLPDIARNLDRFARINNAMVARCRCDGRTNIAVADTGLPAYLLHLDPQTQQSEVLVMPQPQ
jgi:hypothetical protein